MNRKPPDLEESLARLRPVAPRSGLRNEVLARMRRRLSPLRLDRVLPWAIAASLLAVLIVTVNVRERAHAQWRTRIASETRQPLTEDHRRWAAHVRLVQKRGLPNG